MVSTTLEPAPVAYLRQESWRSSKSEASCSSEGGKGSQTRDGSVETVVKLPRMVPATPAPAPPAPALPTSLWRVRKRPGQSGMRMCAELASIFSTIVRLSSGLPSV